jgi:hypothetical protein
MSLSGRWFVVLLVALVLLCARGAHADDDGCFDFASSTLGSLLQQSSVQRLLIVVRNSEVDARLAAKGLSLAVRRRGVEVTIMRNSRALSPHDLAVEEASANQVQMVAIIDVPEESEPETAVAEFRDRAGQKLATLSALLAQRADCEAALAATAQPALARDDGAPTAREEASQDEGPGHTWYGWQLLLADVGSLLLLYNPAPWISAGTYLLVPAAIHAANGQGKRAWLSFGLRLGTPLVATGLGLLALYGGACENDSEPATCGGAMIVGTFVLGMVVAAIIDDAAVAWKASEDPDSRFSSVESRPPRKAAGVAVGVGVLPYRNGAGLGFAGRF